MGCHMWLYKRINSFDKAELNRNLSEFIIEESKTWIGRTSREEYASELYSKLEYDLKAYENNPIMQNCIKEQYGSLEKCYKIWDDWHKHFDQIKLRVKRWIDNPEIDSKEFYNIIREEDSFTTKVKEYKGNYYLFIMFDTYFRCYSYSDEPIDNYEDIIKYLEKLPFNMIEQYGTFINGEFQYYNPITFESKIGLTEELKEMLQFLYKDDDILIEFA